LPVPINLKASQPQSEISKTFKKKNQQNPYSAWMSEYLYHLQQFIEVGCFSLSRFLEHCSGASQDPSFHFDVFIVDQRPQHPSLSP